MNEIEAVESELIENKPVDNKTAPQGISQFLDALLREPDKLSGTNDQNGIFGSENILITLVCLLCYGIVTALFTGGDQLYRVPAKIVVGYLAAAVISFPSFYILTCLSGSKAAPYKIIRAFLCALSLSTVLLAGFVPIVWLFGESTQSAVSMGMIHILISTFAIWGAFGRFSRTLANNSLLGSNLNGFWKLIFLITVFQMTTSLRPILGTTRYNLPKEKRSFVQHWSLCLADEDCLSLNEKNEMQDSVLAPSQRLRRDK